MGILKENLFGSPQIGVFMALNNKFLLYPPSTPSEKLSSFKKAFPKEFPCYSLMINHSVLLGAYIAMNSNGIIVPSVTLESEMEILKDIAKKHEMNICELNSRDNAFGNLILVNDNGAIVSTELKKDQKKIQDALKVEVLCMDYAGVSIAGSSGIANNNGCCVHPLIDENDAEMIAKILKVPVDVSTINQGNPYVHSGAVVNDFGGIFGSDSTGPEMVRLTNMLKL